MIHPARTLAYRDLVDGLREAVEQKLVFERRNGNLALYNYAPSCVYDRAWTPITRLARGLILDTKRECVLATPLPKFFNLNERPDEVPDLPFETFEKLDGSLIILFWDGSEWRCATRGSFDSQQAKDAQHWFRQNWGFGLVKGLTYLCEWIGPSNKIVVPYDEHELVLLAVYDENGYEHSSVLMQEAADALGWRAAKRHDFTSISDLVEHAGTLPATDEGFVIRYTNGHRVKIKGDEYCRIHALISNCTPLAVWQAMMAGDDLDLIRRQLPEEFWGDFDTIHAKINDRLTALLMKVELAAENSAHLTDKELGLILNSYPEAVRRFLFPARKGDVLSGRTRETMFRSIRPTGNVLDGYTPSYAMHRVQDDE